MSGSINKAKTGGFTLVELMIAIAILGILAAISIPNYRIYKDKAEKAAMLTTLKYLMDGEDFYNVENGSFYPAAGTLTIPRETAVDIPQLAYSFYEGHKNRYRIQGVLARPPHNRQRYKITVDCDFDSNGNGKDDQFTAVTWIVGGEVRKNRLVVQTR
jgi:prepilin-type N-terminal cleavage/methylation domain-containing protein